MFDFGIVKKERLADNIVLLDVAAPWVAGSCEPGQFVIAISGEKGERVPLTISDYDREKGTVTIVIQEIGESTKKISALNEGDFLDDFVGPLGQPCHWLSWDIEKLKKEHFLFVAGGLGTAPVYPQVKWLHDHGLKADVIIGSRTKDLVIFREKMTAVAENVFIATDDGSEGFNGRVPDLVEDLVKNQGKSYTHCVAIGPMIMMKFTALKTKELSLPTIVSMNPLMVDGTGMCGACRVTVGGEVKFACVDGPEFDGHLIDFDESMRRQRLFQTDEGRAQLQVEEGGTHHPAISCESRVAGDRFKRVPISEQAPEERIKNFGEVCMGYTLEEAVEEAARCLQCKTKPCVSGCPVNVKIPDFILALREGDMMGAAQIIGIDNSLPAVCGRVCPQEKQCEAHCVVGKKGDSVAIGKLERFVGDWVRENEVNLIEPKAKNGKKVAVIGAGPAGLACTGDLLKMGYEVTLFEALHKPGGVLSYGIPDFRLPNDPVVNYEINAILSHGVRFERDVIIGRTLTIDDLFDEQGFDAVFIGSGAGLPKFLGIEGENLNGVFSANEFLTRANLMKAYREDHDTPIRVGDRVIVVGGGNVAMDAARTARRLGAEVHVVYRRGEAEMPARNEEIHHAKEEGIIFNLLTNPVQIFGNKDGFVTGMQCVEMELGEPDDSGRRRPQEIEGSEFTIEADTVIMALGTSPNPLIANTTKGIEVSERKSCIIADEESGQTTREGVFAGGDTVTGAATVILAMGAGRKSAQAIDEYLQKK